MLTIAEVESASLSGVKEAATALRKVASHLRHEGTSYGKQVYAPLKSGEDWTGAGWAEAKAVVEADGLAIFTAASRLDVAANTLRSFATGIADCMKTLRQKQTEAENDSMTVAGDGTVDVDDGEETVGRKNRAKELEKEIKEQLRTATKLDEICAQTLTRLSGKKAGGKDGYALPVYSAYSGKNLLKRSKKAFGEQYTVPNDVEGISFSLSGSLWDQTATDVNQLDRNRPGNGFIFGPDGRLYPITQVDSTDDVQDGRWRTVATKVDVATFGASTDDELGIAKSATISTGAIDAGKLPANLADGEQTALLAAALAGTGRAALPPGDHHRSHVGKYPGRTNAEREEIVWRQGEAQYRNGSVQPAKPFLPRAGGVGQIGLGAAAGYAAAEHVPDGYEYAYRTTYQEDDSGHRRAVVERYQVRVDSEGRHVVADSPRYGADGEYENDPGRTLDRPRR